jgi:hypothetical protein
MNRRGRILLLEDRYGGIYSGGTWLGVIDADAKYDDRSRGEFAVGCAPSDGDPSAAEFWENPPDWIVAGQSPKHVMDLAPWLNKRVTVTFTVIGLIGGFSFLLGWVCCMVSQRILRKRV